MRDRRREKGQIRRCLAGPDSPLPEVGHGGFEQSLGRQCNAWLKPSIGQYDMMIPDSKNMNFIQFLLNPNFTTYMS